ncbi:MAG TPA: hypothetical protein DCQ34_07860 [Chitinophagaceae bacterium]|nr:hypothetical protein [Chitinophagaceae bacterium]
MHSLFKVHFNWGIYLILGLLIRLVFPNLSWLCYFAVMISLHQFMLLFYSIGHIIPVRYLLGSFMCLQMFIGPTLAYNGLDKFQRGYMKMQVPYQEYFAYVLPAVILFIIGLHIRAGLMEGEYVEEEKVKKFVNKNPQLPYIFVGIGFVASVAASFFRSELGFIFYLLSGFKFIGTFMIILGSRNVKPIVLAAVYGSVIATSLSRAMFHDLLTWVIFLGSVFAIKYKPRLEVKAMFAGAFVLLAVFIQMIKGDYRQATWKEGEEGGIEALQKTIEEGQEKKGIINMEKLAVSNIRINQGYIVTNIMKHVPAKEPHANGQELMVFMEAPILPRIIAPNKLNAGDREFFMKYSGMRIARGTSMGLSSVGDGYINFGTIGGAIFMLIYGMFFSEVLRLYKRFSKYFSILILFTPLVFYYPIRPDCELQTILGHLFKASFLIIFIFQVWKYNFRDDPEPSAA